MAYLYSNLSDFWTSDDEEDGERTDEDFDEDSENNYKDDTNKNYINEERKKNNNENIDCEFEKRQDEEGLQNTWDVDNTNVCSPTSATSNTNANAVTGGETALNLVDLVNDCRNELFDNISISSILQNYDINNFIHNDNLLKYCEAGVTINNESSCNEPITLNEGFNFNCYSHFDYINPPNIKPSHTTTKDKEPNAMDLISAENGENNFIDMCIQNKDELNHEIKEISVKEVSNETGKEDIQEEEKKISNETMKKLEIIPEKQSVKYIRKKWVIEDNESDVSNFSKNDLLLSYDFELDNFQKRAVKHINNFKHVFIAAHTSAGKTLIAEHAIALSIKLNKKAIYTSPIKALSNQKYYEFKNIFKNVGIITGDVKMNVNANCLIMTTEILRNLLYLNDNIINNIHCVIFDEVHYVNDEFRGVIWEESIIMLPPHVQIVLLSATVPNYLQFADWVGFTKQKEVIAISTKKRPIPLLHYIYAHDSLFLIMDEKNKFYSSAFKEIYIKIREKEEAGKKGKELMGSSHGAKKKVYYSDAKNNKDNQMEKQNKTGTTNNMGDKQNDTVKGYYQYCKQKQKQRMFQNEANMKTEIQKLQALIKKLDEDNKLPVVLFCFSRIKCETYAKSMPHLNFLDNKKKSKVHLFIKESASKLCDQDRDLNQIKILSKLLENGIGVHHSGLLPILKEIVEILFSKGLIKVLFATETFAMGINMPAKSVIFTSIYKHDHLKKRILTSSEYTQMSGRAGRRSSDTHGYVYIYCSDNIPDQVQLTEMMMQKAVSLKSKFKVTYNMILKLLINKQINIEKMLFSSFLESCRALQIPLFKKDLKRKKKMLQNIKQVECVYASDLNQTAPIENYVYIDHKLKNIGLNLHKKLFDMKNSNAFVVGRIMLLNTIDLFRSSVYAVYLGCDKSSNKKKNNKVNFAQNSIFFFQNDKEENEITERFFFLLILPDFIGYGDLTNNTNSTNANENGMNNSTSVSNANTNMEKTQMASENINMYENYKNVFACTNNKKDIKITYHSTFDTNDMNKKHFVVCSNVGIENISLITNTIIKIPNVSTNALLNNPKNLLLYTLELDRLIKKETFEPFTLTKMLKSLKCEFYSVLINQSDYLESLKKSVCYNCNLKDEHYELVCKKNDCINDIENIERNINAKSLNLYEDLEGKLNVLKHFSFIDDDNNLTIKGKIASYITLTDEITLTQVIFENVLNNLNPPEIAAVLSCFVSPEKKVEEAPDLTLNLQDVKLALTNIHSKFEEFYRVIRLKISTEEHWKLCNFKLMFIAYKWALGVSFSELLEQSEFEEGLIVRSIQRLDNLCRKVRIAFLYLGNVDLAEKTEKASLLLRRDIVFTTSLYLQ
ncbi:adenosinetriphosphatase [Plasmodium vinckei petteri]|uniref:Adenosinetriphosphatase n=1 Tax=Plasmodium vinckei petteri TaxID=138298 RepID=W7AKC6_PLAVN|nr:adenosinetriphosphatase [Plasmodium vinckei petteri]CAD2106356.1 helicase SKI2W, putative [Plasmodium vinckei petteri]